MTIKNSFKDARFNLPSRDSSSLIERYYDMIIEGSSKYESTPAPDEFEPSMRMPNLCNKMSRFLSPATAGIFELGTYKGFPLRLFDLRQNQNTQTTKTFASLLIVSRAIRYIQETGKSILLFSPSSGNKAIALRDAVARALTEELVRPDQLRIATLTPEQTTDKLRKSILSEDPELRALNPIFVLNGPEPEAVKAVGLKFKKLFNESNDLGGMRLWHSLRLENYRFADQVRAFYDYEFGYASLTKVRTAHVHSVSSAYGLLGYYSGTEVLKGLGYEVADPKFVLVQHIATCDMVVHLLQGTFDDSVIPTYTKQQSGVLEQNVSPNFPRRTWAATESLEHTFYTHKPATATEMSQLISTNGGSGIVVSLLECFERYAKCCHLLENSPISLPTDPRKLNEWSLVMALTGVLNAIDRDLLPDVDGFTIHASGSYSSDDYEKVPHKYLQYIDNAEQMFAAIVNKNYF